MNKPISLSDISQAVSNERTKKAKRKAEEDAKAAVLVDEFLPIFREKVVAKIAEELEVEDSPQTEVAIRLPDSCNSPMPVQCAAEDKIALILGRELASLGDGVTAVGKNGTVRVRIPSKIIE